MGESRGKTSRAWHFSLTRNNLQAEPIPAALLLIGFLILQSPACCEYGLGDPEYDIYNSRSDIQRLNVALRILGIVDSFCNSYDKWLAEKQAVEKAKKEAQAAELADRQAGIKRIIYRRGDEEQQGQHLQPPSQPKGPIDEALAIAALRHLAIFRLDLAPVSERG